MPYAVKALFWVRLMILGQSLLQPSKYLGRATRESVEPTQSSKHEEHPRGSCKPCKGLKRLDQRTNPAIDRRFGNGRVPPSKHCQVTAKTRNCFVSAGLQ